MNAVDSPQESPSVGRRRLQPSFFLRAASILTLLHAVLHTVGGVFGVDISPTPEEAAALAAMKSHRFDVLGSMRSFWDLFLGFGLIISISLLIQAIFFWQLASFANQSLKGIPSIVATFCLGYVGFAILSWNYFFAAPAVTELLIAICLGLAFVRARIQNPESRSQESGVRSQKQKRGIVPRANNCSPRQAPLRHYDARGSLSPRGE